MKIDQRLVSEIEFQLVDDILHFSWLSQIVYLQNPDKTEAECIKSVVDLVIYLHQKKKIVVGNAVISDGMTLIDPWPESGQDLRARMESTISKSIDTDRDFCFWIQLAKGHFEK